MSYDTHVAIDTGHGLVRIEDVGNYTSNVGPMFYVVLPGPYEGGGRYDGEGDSEPRGGLPGLSGLTCQQAAEILREATKQMADRRRELMVLNPENGWGCYDGALRYLRDCLEVCERHPRATFCVNW